MGDLRVQSKSTVDTVSSEGFRETELGTLPKDWKIVRLGDLAAVKYGKAKPKESGEVPAVGSGGVYGRTPVPLVDFPTLVVGRKGTAGKVWLQEQPCWPSDTTFYLEWNSNDIDLYFLYSWLQKEPLSGEHAKTTLPSLSKPDLENHLFPLPPFTEQRAISQVLRTIRKAIESTAQVIEASRELKWSLMNHLLTYGPVPVDEAEQVSLKETEIGPVPEHWTMRHLGELVHEGPHNGIYKPQSLYGDGTPIVRIDDFGNEGGIINFAPLRVRLSPEEIKRYRLDQYDILVNRVNSLSHLGKTTMMGNSDEPVVFESNMMRFSIDRGSAHPEYVSRFLSSPIAKRQIRGAAKRAVAQSSINQGDVKAIIIPVPPIAVQEEIVRISGIIDSKILVEENRKHTLEILSKTLLHNLMTAKVRVKGLNLSETEEQV